MVTLQDIADKAGVSRATVSVVLNNNGKKLRISQKTCERVLMLADTFGYTRNEIARAVKTGKTNIIGITGELYSNYCLQIIKGINNIISKNDYMIKLLPINTKIEKEVENLARICKEQCLAGVIYRSSQGVETLYNKLHLHNIPIVLVDSSFSHEQCSQATSDDVDGAKMATEYLISEGHRKIVHMNHISDNRLVNYRCQGYLKAMHDADLKTDIKSIFAAKSSLDISDLAEISDFLISVKPDAVFCSSDYIALKVIIAATKSNIKIPEDLSVVGYAGLECSFLSNPPLTTVEQPFTQMGEKAAQLLLANIDNPSDIQKVKLKTKLITRESTTINKNRR